MLFKSNVLGIVQNNKLLHLVERKRFETQF